MSQTEWTPHPGYLETRFRVCQPLSYWPSEFAIISAHATTGERWSERENEACDMELEEELWVLPVWQRRITGFSPETGHEEPSWAVELPLERAIDLGRRFRQDAIFHVVGDDLSVVSCGEGTARTEMGGFRQRLELDPDPVPYRYTCGPSLSITSRSGASFRS